MKSTSGTSSAVQSVLPADEKPRLSQNEKVKDTRPEPAQNLSTRNVTRGVWELARLHTREAWLCWYPAVWGACLAAGTLDISLDALTFCKALFGIWSSVTVTHCTFCTFNDICDCQFDKDVERCKVRPLPSGMISYGEAVTAFIGWIPIMLGTTYYTLGTPGVVTFIPVWVFSLIYPSMKRVMPFPQVILGVTIGAAVFPGWAAVTNSLEGLEEGLPLFAATMTWVIYFDVFYATQDHQDDRKIGVKSLAVLLGDQTWIFLAFLGFLQVMLFAVTALKANMSYIWWVLGLGVWALNIPWHVLSLDMNDRRSGAKIFKANIMLGLYMTGIALVELLIMRVYLRTLLHIAEHAIDVDSTSYKNLSGGEI